MTNPSERDPRGTMGTMVAMRYGNIPTRAILAAETVGTASIDGREVAFEVQVWTVPTSNADAGTHYLRVWTDNGFRRAWSFTPKRAAAYWSEYVDTIAGIARESDGVAVTHKLERAA